MLVKLLSMVTVEEIFYDPKHPYTWSLLSSLPQLSDHQMVIFTLFQELRHHLYAPIKGDAFALRSDYAMQIDFEEEEHLLSK